MRLHTPFSIPTCSAPTISVRLYRPFETACAYPNCRGTHRCLITADITSMIACPEAHSFLYLHRRSQTLVACIYDACRHLNIKGKIDTAADRGQLRCSLAVSADVAAADAMCSRPARQARKAVPNGHRRSRSCTSRPAGQFPGEYTNILLEADHA